MSTKPETQWERAELIAYYSEQYRKFGNIKDKQAAALLADGKAGVEPIGWMRKRDLDQLKRLPPGYAGVVWPTSEAFSDGNGVADIPVFTRPQPAAQVAQPLTRKQTDAIWDQFQEAPHMEFRYLVTQALEAAHGIGKDQA